MEHDLLERCSELGEIREPSAQAKFLSLNPQLLQLRTVEELAEAVRSIIRVDVRKAIALAEAALVIAQELGVDNALARALRARANTMWMTGECKIAVDLFAKAAVLFEQASEMGEVGRTLSSSIQALSLLGEYDKAYAAAAEALHLRESLDS